MKTQCFLWTALAAALFSIDAHAQENPADVLADPVLNLRRPADRAKAVERMRVIENANRERARAKANAQGIPMRRELPGGRVTEIMGLDENGEFLINTTRNANAAISSAANLVHSSPYNLNGSNLVVGVWDGGAVLTTHQEFQTGSGSRVTVRDGSTTLSSHATHVAGTVAAAGVTANAKGMAPSALVDSYEWTSDDSEMTAAAATSPAQAGKLTISNHSYGYSRGWDGNTWMGTGTDQNAYASQFGQYSSKARSWDLISYNAPYYLIFHSAGNDNSENPNAGAQVVIGGSTVTYDRTIHPPGDGFHRNTTTSSLNGYENIGDQANSKNIMVVGAANDAVTSGLRDPAKSTLTSFSSRGPTDDGRIKPDIVANGASLYSTNSTGDAVYATMSGTSMSGPSAAGSAALLVHQHRNLFPGGDMRASTLKGLILHTATDVGNPGPDYHFGWGLIDMKTAADVIIDHHADPTKGRMIEDQLNTTVTNKTFLYNWDGSSPIRATICWTDPAAASTTSNDLRTSRLLNDLDIKLIAPDGTTQYYPFVMPYVGTWTAASMSQNATTGVNSTDNVEQVLIPNPGQLGQWQIVVTHKGTLTNNLQNFSLITSGLSAGPPDMSVSRGATAVPVGGSDAVTGATAGAGTQLTYTISNVGGSLLQLTAPLTISGQSNCSVVVNTQPASTVAANASTNLVLTITPGSGGWSFNVSIPNDDPDKNPYHWTVGGVASSETQVVLYPVADTYIDDQATGTNYGGGLDIQLNNRTGNPNKSVLRGLILFDLSAITGNPTLTSAKLDFVQGNVNSGSVDIVEATGTWDEVVATWSNSSTLFGGVSYGTATTGSTAGAAVPTITLNAAGLSKVQSWLPPTSGNNGFGITTTYNGNGSWLALRTREAVEASRPKLTLTYSGGASTAPVMAVTGSQGGIPNGGSESVSVSVSGVASQRTYSIANLGNANLTLTTPVTATPVSNCSISVTTQPTSPVAASGSTNLVLNVTPTAAGTWSATVSIANNDSSKNPYTWTISGSALGSYTLTYNGNSSESGTAPVDANSPYVEGTTVTVLGNTSVLIRTGFSFAGWNTAANGSGTSYQPGATFTMPASNVTLHAVWNAPPTVEAGPNQTVNLTGGEWTPLQLDPGLWLDASDTDTITLNGATVSQWADKSGFNRHATQLTSGNQPTNTPTGLNSKRVLTFDGTTDLFEVNLDFLADVSHSAFIVTKPTTYSNIYGAANGSAAANSLHVGFGSNTGYRMNFWGNDYTPAVTANFVAGSANILNYVWNTGVSKQIFANGKSEGSNTNAGTIGTMSGGGRIGRTTGHAFFGGDIAEIILIPTVLSLEDRQALEGYLAHKWGLTANLDANHPYKTDPPVGTTVTTTLAGSATDPETDPMTTQWTLQSGQFSMAFGNSANLASTATFIREGVYTLRLTANDASGSAFDDVTITVNPPTVERAVTYAGNGNTGGAAPVDPSSPYADSSTVTVLGAGTLVKTGHTFAGWNTNANGSGTPYAAAATFTIGSNVTLHAQWTPNTYTVTFDPNGGGTPNPQTKQVTFGSTYGALATVSRTGYSFDGWFTAISGGTVVASGTNVDITADQTLYAQWTLIPVSVVTNTGAVGVPEGSTATFQVKLSNQPAGNTTVTVARSSGDTDISIQSGGSLSFTTATWDAYQTVTLAAAIDGDAQNGTATITCTPSDPAFISAQVTATEVDKDTTLTVASGGNGSTSPSGAIIVVKGATTAISATANAGYDFVNWTIPNGSATLGNANSASTTASITAPATVQANFVIRQYTLTYTAGTGGTISGVSPQTVNHGANGTQVTAVPDSGYTFVKWSDNVLTASRTDTSITSNLSVAAEFSANTYDVVFDANGGTAADPSGKQVTFAAPYGTLATTSRTGYSFNGWFTAASGGTEVTSATTVSTASNHTLYAQWTADTYVVSYLGNGNTTGTAPANDDKIHDVDLTLATNTGNLTKTGYSFAGWNTALDGSGADYAAGVSYTANAALTLYAKWLAGADGTWVQTAAGPYDWGTAANWSDNIVASGSDRTAFFTPNITATQVVNLEAPYTIGNITFTDSTSNSNNLTISGANALTLSRSSGTPVIDVTQSGRTLTISNEIAGSNGLQKNGPGILDLRGSTNSYSGNTVLNSGQVTINSNANFGATTGDIVFNGDVTLRLETGVTLATDRTITIDPGVTATLSSTNNGNTFQGAIEGSGSLIANHTTTFAFPNTANTFSGTLSSRTGGITSYGLDMASINDGSGAGLINLGNGTTGGTFRWIAPGGTGTTTLLNRQFALSGTTGMGTICSLGATSSDNLIITKDLLISGTGNKKLLLAGTNAGNNTFAGKIADGSGSAITVEKTEGGTWGLGGTNTYTGNTNLIASATTGRLVFQGSQSLSANTKLVFAQASSSVQSVRFLDDGTGTINFARPIEFGGSNTMQNLNLFVGNNNTSNLGSSSGTTAGSTIQAGDITFTSIAGDTNTTTINATGANNYRLETGTITINNLVTRAAGSTTVTALNPTTANMTVAAITMATGNTGILNDGVPVVRLDGTSTDNHVTGAVSNASDYLTGQALSLQKQNSSTWILSGANTYTGTTTVSAGKLFINGDSTSATGAVSVAANATLGGTGIIGGNTTIAATGKLEFDLSTADTSHNKLELATGKTLTFSGASVLTITSSGGAQTGTYTLLTAPGGISGVAPATLNLPVGWAATVSIVGNDLLLDVTSTGLDHFAISSIASTQTVGTAITGITITAKSAADLTVTSFTGTVTFGGTAGITGTSASFVAGVLTGVSVTPAIVGADLTLTVDDGSSHTGSVIFTVQSIYESWAGDSNLSGGDAGSGADPDGDGITNLQAFAFGTNPTAGRPSPVSYDLEENVTPGIPTIMKTTPAPVGAPPFEAVFTRRKDHAAAGLTYTVEFSADLANWPPPSPQEPDVVATGGLGPVEAVSVPFPATVLLQGGGSAPPKFFRVKVTGN